MILVMAGTSDARELAIAIQTSGNPVLASVVTESAATHLQAVGIASRQGRLNLDQFVHLLNEAHISLLIDASHPFAEEAHKTAMQAASKCEIPYVRYERGQQQYGGIPGVTLVDTYEQAAQAAKRRKGSVMLTTGSKTLHVFTPLLLGDPEIRLVVRLLPLTENMDKCARLGVAQQNIIAMQGPFSRELNIAFYQHYKTTLMITKESGSAGAVDEKLRAALDLGIEVIVIGRPKLACGNSFSSVDGVLGVIAKWRDDRDEQ